MAREAAAHGRTALQIDSDDPDVLAYVAFSLLVMGQFGKAEALSERAIAINPNAAFAHATCGWACSTNGATERGLQLVARASRLSPRDPLQFYFLWCEAICRVIAGDFPAALAAAERVLVAKPGHLEGLVYRAAALAGLGRKEEAARIIAEAKRQFPRLALEIYQRPRTSGNQWQRVIDAIAATGLT